ncbi:hypothetical protein [Lysinibacillus sp. 3P01SB]|uniref:hypothetical protein n=1 Tax=Lysinibacillus sp. 3P01SB TaxID=3132284 RepID=UPI0039A411B3
MNFNIPDNFNNMSTSDKLVFAESLFIDGNSIRKIAGLLKMSNGKISDYLKKKGYTITARVGNTDYNRQALFERLENIWLAKGGSIKKLCIENHTTPTSFITYLRSKGHVIKPHRNPRNEEAREEKLRKAEGLFLQGYTVSDVARKVKINNAVLADYLKARNIDALNYWKIPLANERIFEVIDTEQKAYWLGFFYADANITNQEHTYSLDIVLKIEDIDHLVKLKNFLQTDAKITEKIIKNKNGKIYRACRLTIHNKKMIKDLTSKGCVPKKSLIIEFPDETILPSNLKSHFIRGYFDGDGCLYIPKKAKKGPPQATISFLGTKNFLLRVRKELSLTDTVLRKRGNVYISAHGGNSLVDNYLKQIYYNATIYLERKYLKYQAFLAKYSKRGV